HVAALSILRAYLAANPEDFDGWLVVGELELSAGEPEAARSSLQRYVHGETRAEAVPWRARATRLLASLSTTPTQEASSLSPVLDTPGDDGGVDEDTASQAGPSRFARALRARAQRGAARLLLEEGRVSEALAAYERLLLADPESEVLQAGLAEAEAALRKPDGSAPVEGFSQLLAAGAAGLVVGDGESAKNAYEKSLALAEGSARVHVGLARAHELLGDVTKALQHYRRHRELLELPEDSEAADDLFWRLDSF
ncbi:MAG: tetratricopeptide repeat protein, partial [Myxococcota bacterium]